jgi:hypothetical protein
MSANAGNPRWSPARIRGLEVSDYRQAHHLPRSLPRSLAGREAHIWLVMCAAAILQGPDRGGSALPNPLCGKALLLYDVTIETVAGN